MLRAYLIMALLFSVLAGTMFFGTVQAESSVPKPSVPEFTVKFVGQPYDVPTTYGLDPYTGENVTIMGYRVINGSIVMSIKNQLFDSSSTYSLYYKVRSKGHYETNNWTIRTENLYVFDTGVWSSTLGIKPSDSEYTVLYYSADYPSNSKVDFQVQALVFNMTPVFYSDHPLAPSPFNQAGHYEQHPTFFTASDWSDTQTITIPESQMSTPSPEPTPTPTNYNELQSTEQEVILGVAVTVTVLSAGLGLLIYLIKRK